MQIGADAVGPALFDCVARDAAPEDLFTHRCGRRDGKDLDRRFAARGCVVGRGFALAAAGERECARQQHGREPHYFLASDDAGAAASAAGAAAPSSAVGAAAAVASPSAGAAPASSAAGAASAAGSGRFEPWLFK